MWLKQMFNVRIIKVDLDSHIVLGAQKKPIYIYLFGRKNLPVLIHRLKIV
jgi:hypothetical protein